MIVSQVSAFFAISLLCLVPSVAGAQDARAEVAELRDAGRYDAAIALARRAGLQNALGELLMLTGRTDQASTAFRSALRDRQADSLTARLNLAILRYQRGERDEAMEEFDAFIDVYNRGRRLTSPELTAVAIAVQYLSSRDPQLARDALRAYDEAIAADSTNLEPRIRLGELFLGRYNGTDARETFEEILERWPDHPRGLLGLARTTRFEGSRQAIDLARESLEQNPNLVAARVFLAELLAELEEYAEAEQEIGRALEVNPGSLEALSRRAAIAFLRDDQALYRETTAQITNLNPSYSDLYTTLSEVSQRNRLYDKAAEFAASAVELDPRAWHGYALLGINQLRTGSMDSGRVNLEKAFEGDPYDVWTKNTLDLLDTLDRYPSSSSRRFRFLIDHKESELLALYLGDLAEQAFEQLAARYRFEPATPIRVEVFPDHADFSVRTVGLAGLGALGVSFGPVIAMDSPSARQQGDFNWGSTFWHELAHTFHLGLSGHRVPRWLTEGLAVYEERRARPGWGDDVSPAFLAAYKQDRLHPVSKLNDGFVRPSYPQQIIFSYYQASLVCEMIEREHGFDTILGMLSGYRDGLNTAEVFRRVLETDLDEFDGEFDRWFREQFAGPLAAIILRERDDSPPTHAGVADRARRNPGDFFAQLAMGQLMVRDGQLSDAITYLEQAKALFPQYAGDDSPYRILAHIYRERGQHARAAAELQALVAINERSYDALMELADLKVRLQDERGAADALDRSMYVYPYDMAAHQQLAELSEQIDDVTTVVRERRAVLALQPVDRAEAWYQLARAHLLAGDRDSARRAVLRALEDAPGFEEAQELLLEIHGGGGGQ